jgi:hypothetical protein
MHVAVAAAGEAGAASHVLRDDAARGNAAHQEHAHVAV